MRICQTHKPQGVAKTDSMGSSWPEVRALCQRPRVHPDAQVRLADPRLKTVGGKYHSSFVFLHMPVGQILDWIRNFCWQNYVNGADFLIMILTLYKVYKSVFFWNH